MKKYYSLLIALVFTAVAEINAQCVADYQFSVAPSSMTVNYTNLSTHPTGLNMSYSWWFGDGNTSSQVSPTHTYTQAGTYIVYLSMYDSQNTCFDSTSYYVTVPGQSNACSASYTVSKDPNANMGVLLTNNSSNLSTHSYFWDFGDGNTSTMRNPTHFYQNYGSYRVCLTILDSTLNCSSTFCDSLGMDSLGNLKAAGFGLRVVNATTTDIDEQSLADQLNIYPNPAQDQININLGNNEREMEIRLLNLNGKSVRKMMRTGLNEIESINLSGLENGIYLLHLTDGDQSIIRKIVKQ